MGSLKDCIAAPVGPNNPLPFKVCLLDENSMNNSWLFYKVLAALDKNTILIMLGDPAQLPPIGSGDPFADIIAHRLCPVAALTKIHRQEAGSVLMSMANTIRQGKVPEGYKAKGYKDFFFIDKSIPNWYQLRRTAPQSELDRLRDENNQEIVDYIRRCCERLKPQLENVVTDFQVLSPIRKGALGVDALNAAVQEVMNPPEGQAEIERFGVIFREGDKVVHTQNKNMPVCTAPMYLDDPDGADFSGDARIFNGQRWVDPTGGSRGGARRRALPLDQDGGALRVLADEGHHRPCLGPHGPQITRE